MSVDALGTPGAGDRYTRTRTRVVDDPLVTSTSGAASPADGGGPGPSGGAAARGAGTRPEKSRATTTRNPAIAIVQRIVRRLRTPDDGGGGGSGNTNARGSPQAGQNEPAYDVPHRGQGHSAAAVTGVPHRGQKRPSKTAPHRVQAIDVDTMGPRYIIMWSPGADARAANLYIIILGSRAAGRDGRTAFAHGGHESWTRTPGASASGRSSSRRFGRRRSTSAATTSSRSRGSARRPRTGRTSSSPSPADTTFRTNPSGSSAP